MLPALDAKQCRVKVNGFVEFADLYVQSEKLRDVFLLRGHRSFLLWFSKEVIEPVLHQLQSLPFDSINAHAPFLLTAKQPRSFEHLQVTRRRLPRVREG